MRLLTALLEIVGAVVGGFVELFMTCCERIHARIEGQVSSKGGPDGTKSPRTR
jgi:hypothetical protein